MSPEQTPNTTPSSASPTPGTTPDSAKGSGSKQKSTDKAAAGLTASDMVHCHLPCALSMSQCDAYMHSRFGQH